MSMISAGEERLSGIPSVAIPATTTTNQDNEPPLATRRTTRGWMALLGTPRGKSFLPMRDRRIYILWIALVWSGMAAGFVPDMARYLAETPAPPFILHLHGAFYFLWLVAVTLQIALIEVHNPALHRRLGWWVVGLSVPVVALGLAAAMVDMARAAPQTFYQPEFLALEFQSMLVFPILLTLGALLRRDLAAHKRLMILMLVCLLDPGTSRAWGYFSPYHPAGPFGFWVRYFWANDAMLLAMIGWDQWRHSRIHPVLFSGGALLLAGQVVAVMGQFSPWWHVTADHLVKAWGWTG